MIQDYDNADDTVTFVQTANPTPTVNFGWEFEDYDNADDTVTFVQTANPTPTVNFGWSN
jgi:hypothetical protein